MKNFLLFAIPCMILSFFYNSAGTYLYHPQECYTVSYQPGDYAPSARQLDNPYRGWYNIYGYALSDSNPVSLEQVRDAIAKDSNQLVLLEINLRSYAGSEISPVGLSQLESVLLAWGESGRQLILRFLYDWNGKARETEPGDISIIKRHMEQTGEIVNKFTNRVFLMQGIYVGNCGEMNNSDYMSLEKMRELAAHLDSVIDPAIYLSVRTPEHYRIVSRSHEPLPAADAFSGKISARTGLFNDGMLGSESDLGTYGDAPFSPTEDFTGKGTRSEEISFQNTLCEYVPNGGEVVLDNTYNDFPNAVADLNAMHVSYLDCGYDRAVLDKWRNARYDGEGCFNGMDGYAYIGEHLGYRYAIQSSACSFDALRDTNARLSVTMENSGFSVTYRPFSSMITILRADGSLCDRIFAQTDARLWKSGACTTWSVPLDVNAYRDGTYQVYYRLYDPATRRAIRLANDIPATRHGYYIGSFKVEGRESLPNAIAPETAGR